MYTLNNVRLHICTEQGLESVFASSRPRWGRHSCLPLSQKPHSPLRLIPLADRHVCATLHL